MQENMDGIPNLNSSELSKLIRAKGMQVAKWKSIIEIDRWICIKPFDEIDKDLCVWAGYDRDNFAFIIDEEPFKDIFIGPALFIEHFSLYSMVDFEVFRAMSNKQRAGLSLTFFGDGANK